MSTLDTRTDEYEAFCSGVQRLTGVDLLQYKRGQMERRIATFAQRRGAHGLLDYLRRLDASREELGEFLDRVTINVSQLWRNPEQWERLEGIVRELAQRGWIRAWSAGCSYGAEAYTLAAICRDAVPTCRLEILGTDIDARMIERARAGGFSEADARTAPPAALRRWFEPDGGGWRAGPALRTVVRFQAGDLLRDRVPSGAYDLVLCRNVVIYFTDPVREDLHKRLAESLRPGGYLVIGSTERVTSPAGFGLSPIHPFIYRKG